MWITCFHCLGSGFEYDKFTYHRGYKQRIICRTCNPQQIILDNLFLGLIWVEDNHDPVSPPPSP